jgi:hypothetical protein
MAFDPNQRFRARVAHRKRMTKRQQAEVRKFKEQLAADRAAYEARPKYELVKQNNRKRKD